jgi:hypothetical protein
VRAMQKRLTWFDEGSAAFNRAFGDVVVERDGVEHMETVYPCPLCLRLFTRDAVVSNELTEEHVPPGSLGGRGLLLTCRNCNNTAGHELDADALTRHNAERFVRGESVRPIAATFKAGGFVVRGTAEMTSDTLKLQGVEKQNDEKVVDQFVKALESDMSGEQPRFSFTILTKYDDARARLSWIRSAYLAAFAACGWRYIFTKELDAVRSGIAKPDSRGLSTHVMRVPGTDPALRRILIVSEPSDLQCLAIIMGEFVVFLPSPVALRTWDEIVKAFQKRTNAAGQLQASFSGQEFPWPSRATYFLDPASG